MKKILKNCLIATTLLAVIGGASLASINLDSNNTFQLSENTSIKTNGIQLKLLNSSLNSYGEKDQTFTYTISPYNASNQDVDVTLTYIDGTDCSNVMSYTLDSQTRTITLSCKADFDKKITCKLVSKANSNAFSEVTIDYVKKVKRIYLDTEEYNTMTIGDTGAEDDGDNVVRGYVNVIKDFTIEYSTFTKDQTYNIRLKEADKFKIFYYDNYQTEIKAYLDSDPTLVASLENYINDLVLNPRNYSYEDLWDLDADDIDKWHNTLLNEYSRGYDPYKTPWIYFKIDSVSSYVFEDTNTHQTYQCDSNLNYIIALVIHGDMSKYYVNVESMEVENSSLEF